MKKNAVLIRIIFIMIILCFIFGTLQYVFALAANEVDLSVGITDAWNKWKAISRYNNGVMQYPGQWSLNSQGGYIVNAENTDNMTGFYNPTTNFSDMDISMNMGSWNGDDDTLGCMIRFSEDASHNVSGYIFAFDAQDSNGGFVHGGLYKINGKQFETASLTTLVSFPNITWVRGKYHKIRLIAKGNNIKVYIDGILRANYTDPSPIKQGSYGFFSASQPDARFKDIQGVATLATYNVTFDPNGGTMTGSNTKTVVSTKPYGTLPTIGTRTGYTSDKQWYTARTGGSVISSTSIVEIASDITLYAHWTPIGYTVKYNGNGATGGSTANSSHTYDAAKNLSANGFERKYTVTYNHNYNGSTNTSKTAIYTFKNWNTVAGGTGSAYNNSASVVNLTSTSGAIVNLYAQWNSASVSYTPTRTGYTFGGWYREASCTNKVSDGTYTPTANITLYAKWIPNNYTVAYNGNGATGGSTASSIHAYDTAKNLTANGFERKYTVTYNHNYAESVNTSRIATYTFKNWNTVAGGTGTVYNNSASVINLSSTSGAIINLYAQWNSASVSYTPTRTGYIFAGWYRESACTNQITSSSNTTYTPTANITLYAKWIPINYTVTYNGNKSTGGSTANSSHTYDAIKNLTANGFERKYTVTYNHNYPGSTNTSRISTYGFIGWSTTADGIKVYNDEQGVVNLSSTNGATVNLYAQWNSASIDYIPVRTGYIFVGWYKEFECINKVSDGLYTPTADITLYAKWIPISYVIKYNGNGATEGNTASSLHVYDVPQNLTINSYKRKYTVTYNHNFVGSTDISKTATYTFKGWGNSATGEVVYNNEQSVVNLSSTNGSTVDLYALWNSDSVSYVPSREGYIFYGWYSDALCTNKVTEDTFVPTSDITLYAKWSPTEYTIRYNGNGATSGSTTDSKHVYDIDKKLSPNGYEREYTVVYNHNYEGINNVVKTAIYTFDGWSTSENGKKIYSDEQNVLNLTATDGSTVDLYAVWNTDSVEYTPTRTGYTFLGWYSDKECTNKVIGAEDTTYIPTSDIELYAGWQINDYEYRVEYYYNGVKDNSETERKKVNYLTVIDTYKNKIKDGYKFDFVDNLPLTVTEKEETNVIRVYYKTNSLQTKTVTYTVLFYKDGKLDLGASRTIRKTIQALLPDEVQVDKNLIDANKYDGYELERTNPDPIPDVVASGSVINVYYVSKKAEVVIKYVDKYTGEEIADEKVIEGKINSQYDITGSEKEVEGYTLVESPENLTGTYTKEREEFVYYYAKNSNVIVKYLEKETDEEIAEETIIQKMEKETYETTGKEIENYELVGIPENSKGTVGREDIEVVYYYVQKTKVTVNHINIISGDVLETEEIAGKVGDKYNTTSKDIDGYILVTEDEDGNNILPENANGTMTKEEIIVNYYYKHVSAGVIVKHIDKNTNEILDNEQIEGNEGDEYTTTPKEFEGYDLDETTLPENAEGTMTQELIEVKYYYIRKAQVKVQYLDRNTNEELLEKETIEGHEGDEYTTSPKEIEEYYLVESMLPENAQGTMTKEEIIVRYYYAKKSAGVLEKHINEKTGEVIEEKLHEGLEGDDYKIEAKNFETYDLDTSKLPENSEGTMTEELIEVDYYYIRKAHVKVEYINEFTNEVIEQEVIVGHEGDSYKTKPKEIKNYILDEEKLPENSEGIMEVTVNEDGTINSEIVVKYYYKQKSAGVIERHIDIKTEKVIQDEVYEGMEGNPYKTTAKEYEEYDLVTTKLPENAEGTMTEELIEVKYYYIRKSTVRVEYVDNETGKKISEDTIINGHEDDEYKTEAKEIKDYTLDKNKLPENSQGTMKVVRSEYFVDDVESETVVRYYYDKNKKLDGDGSNQDNTGKPSDATDNNTKPDNKPNNNNNKPNDNTNNGNNNSNGGGTTVVIKSDSPNVSNGNSNNNSNNSNNNSSTNKVPMPSTGDIVPVIAIAMILLVGVANILQIVISKRSKNK